MKGAIVTDVRRKYKENVLHKTRDGLQNTTTESWED